MDTGIFSWFVFGIQLAELVRLPGINPSCFGELTIISILTGRKNSIWKYFALRNCELSTYTRRLSIPPPAILTTSYLPMQYINLASIEK